MRRAVRHIAILAIAALVLAVFTAPAAAFDIKQSLARFSGTAGETLALGDVVCIKGSDGYVYEADADDSDLRPALGIVGHGGSSGSLVEVLTICSMSGWSSLTPGMPAFLSATASEATQTAPTSWQQQIGIATSSTTYYFDFRADANAATVLGTLYGASPIVVEGTTEDAYETTFTFTDPTADRTVTYADAGGTVMLTAVSEKTASYSVTAAETGTTFTNEGASGSVEFDLPDAATGLIYCFANAESGGYTILVDPTGSDQIPALTDSAGDRAEAGENDVGHTICLHAIDEVYWIIRSYYGASWADAN